MSHRKKLIEVALPLAAINRESGREKSIRSGHPSTIHLWWSRKPLATCRAVLFASLVDDPSSRPEAFPTEEAQEQERSRLFHLMAELVKWESTSDEQVLAAIRAEVQKATGGNPPPVLDPFCGGGSIPLEAQRLGLAGHGSDLNPVAVLITKALVELPPRFAGRPPVAAAAQETGPVVQEWLRAHGLAADVRAYGRILREEAFRRIGHLYPTVALPDNQGEARVIAWVYGRTVTCPNPACGVAMPLVSKFWLSSRTGKEVWIHPAVDRAAGTIRYEVRSGRGAPPVSTVSRRGAACIACGSPVTLDYVRADARAGRMGAELMAIVAAGPRGRVYLPPTPEHVAAAAAARPHWRPDAELFGKAAVSAPLYGMTAYGDLFTPRQLVALTTFSDLIRNLRAQVAGDARSAGCADAEAYADAVVTYLAFALDKCADYWNVMATWAQSGEFIRNLFARQAIPMAWDFVECNPFSDSTASWSAAVEWVARALQEVPAGAAGTARQLDAATQRPDVPQPVISTDPPYYDNICYADLSDFFYVWLRRSLGPVYPELFPTMMVPKAQELVASPYRWDGDRDRARAFFEQGLERAFARMREAQHPDYPMTIYYAFKQAESEEEGEDGPGTYASTGWETMLEGLLRAGFTITGTWPMRSERSARSVAIGTNALASSIVLVCRPRPAAAPPATRREFIAALKRELPQALRQLQRGHIAPVDLAQAAIGPGMAAFSRYSRVLEADGRPMSVRAALGLINEILDEVLAEQEGEYDADTRWALAWFEQYGMGEGAFGVAETLSKAKNTSVEALHRAGLLIARGGKVRLVRRDEFPDDWDPARGNRMTVWEATQHLIRRLDRQGEAAAAALLRCLGAQGEPARDLAYRLYSICERKGWARDAVAYNTLVVAWPRLSGLAARDGEGRQMTIRV